MSGPRFPQRTREGVRAWERERASEREREPAAGSSAGSAGSADATAGPAADAVLPGGSWEPTPAFFELRIGDEVVGKGANVYEVININSQERRFRGLCHINQEMWDAYFEHARWYFPDGAEVIIDKAKSQYGYEHDDSVVLGRVVGYDVIKERWIVRAHHTNYHVSAWVGDQAVAPYRSTA